MKRILTSMVIALILSIAMIGMAGADPFTYVGKDTTKMIYDLQILGGKDVTALTGSGIFDFSASTGAFKTSSGTNTFSGNGAFAAGKNLTLSNGGDITMAGAGAVFTGVSGVFSSDVTVNGILGVGTNVSNGKVNEDMWVNGSLAATDTSALNYTTVTDIRASDDGYFADDVGIGGTAALNETTATTITATSTIQGADGRFTDDALVDDDFYVDGSATLNDLTVNTTATITGKLATGLAPTYTHQDWSYALNVSANADKTVYLVGNASANQTMILDTVAASAGKSYTFVTVTELGTYYFILEGNGAETINGAANIASTAQYDAITVYCDGVAWFVTNKIGTWTAVIP